ncbi:MAG: aminodeoxychorismate lyase [Candidatus Obscuribacterales bacterium]|nr:aminodeoxychorismate lyase [Steroidobacteraceae bacterium]
MIALLINGEPAADIAHAISAADRGLQYGDGVFETMRLYSGEVQYWQDHYARLQAGCVRLGIAVPTLDVCGNDIAKLATHAPNAVVKLMVTRGVGGRGYRPTAGLDTTRITSLHPLPSAQPEGGIAVRWCTTRWARNPQLAGIKHLNRLEQVLAQNEWHDEIIAEGLMSDTEGELISATAANVFIVSGNVLATPDLRYCGIRGVMRKRVLMTAVTLGIRIEERALWPRDLLSAQEVFITNAIRGIRYVRTLLEERHWQLGPVTQRIISQLTLP